MYPHHEMLAGKGRVCGRAHRLRAPCGQMVDNYEYELPSDFEDEEIDEDTAFTGVA